MSDAVPAFIWLIGSMLVLALLTPLIAFAVKRLRDAAYAKKALGHGWTFYTSPGPDAIVGLNCPPFGVGRGREVDDLVTGATASGVPFRAVRYRADGVRPTFVAALALTAPLPEAQLSAPGGERQGLTGVRVLSGGWSVIAADAGWASEVGARLGPVAAQVAALAPGVRLSLDGASLVVEPLPREPDLLAPLLEASAAVARAADALQPAYRPPVPAALGFHDHPGWVYRTRDDSWLGLLAHTPGGHDHEARDVVLADAGALRLLACVHHWLTTETRTVTDADGKSHTETYTQSHSEPLAEIHLGFPFGDLSLNWGVFGGRLSRAITFESDDFNRRYRVAATDERFAYDVFHPRQLEWLLSGDAPAFAIESGRMHLDVPDTDLATLESRLAFAQGFFGRVRRFTWDNLGLAAPPLPSALTD